MVSAVTLIAVVAAVIGTVTTIAFHSYMYGKLDDQLDAIAVRAAKPPGGGTMPGGGVPQSLDPLAFVDARGLPVGAFGAVVADGAVTSSRVVVETTTPGPGAEDAGQPMTAAQGRALEAAGLSAGEDPRTPNSRRGAPGVSGSRL
ncbi:two-component system, OmpR family, sensor kinase [Streptomyces atratus]|uniref:Two-component system, OmpR family, sensor kinase n=1 Tax=Streptomyces atratus TaxID=1893 RepID=A0A1K2EUQ3_STRAR|nr:two-component system, OmpR family, sensor kinase [Streptomyces atratus]